MSNDKIERTNWKPKVNINDGIKELIEHYIDFKEIKFDRNY